MKNYAVSEQGAKDMIKSVCICILVNIALMLPTGLLYVLAEDILNDAPFAHARMLLIGSILTIALLGILYYMQYNATFFAMYQESGNKRISLAEKLRRMPLSFFDQKDSADLTTVILGDVAALEHAGKAVSLEPQNMEYQMLRQRLQSGGQWYESRQAAYGYPNASGNDLCLKICLANVFCNLCCGGGGLCFGGYGGRGMF